jgi:hypothetical protein
MFPIDFKEKATTSMHKLLDVIKAAFFEVAFYTPSYLSGNFPPLVTDIIKSC